MAVAGDSKKFKTFVDHQSVVPIRLTDLPGVSMDVAKQLYDMREKLEMHGFSPNKIIGMYFFLEQDQERLEIYLQTRARLPEKYAHELARAIAIRFANCK